MKNKKEAIVITVGVLFLAFILVYTMGLFEKLGQQVAQEFYVNAKGQKWSLPTEGTYEFTASSGGYPKFLSGKIEPLKVSPGDTQTMAVRVASPVPLKGVVAYIETDTRVQEVPLILTENKALSAQYFEGQPYLINEKNKLIINKAGSKYAEKALKQIVESAEAQSLVEYAFEGSWTVNDTHTKNYRTKFVAENESGERNELVLGWSDPVCEFDSEGFLLGGGCTIGELGTSTVEGFDGGDVTIPDGASVVINDDATFVWNGDADYQETGEERTLTVERGANIVLQSNAVNRGQLKESLVWYWDVDGDTFTPDWGTMHYECLDQCTGEIRVKNSPSRPWYGSSLANNGLDCLDDPTVGEGSAFDVHPQLPGQEKYFKDGYDPGTGESTHDYDCSGSIEGGWGDNAPVLASTTLIYQGSISGGHDEGGGEQSCIVGIDTSGDFTPYCGTLSPSSLSGCDINEITGGQQGSEQVFPEGVDKNGWMYGACELCIGTSLAGFCR